MEDRKSKKDLFASPLYTKAHSGKKCDAGQDKLAHPRNFDTRKEINPRTLPA
jgi:hypothetical protein